MNQLHPAILCAALSVLIVLSSCSLFRLGAFNTPSSNFNSGDPAAGIFVATNGNDTNSGTSPDSPVLSIQLAISNAVARGYTNVYIQSGTYYHSLGLNGFFDGIVITNGPISIIGGYDSSFLNRTGYSELDGESVLYHVISIQNTANIKLEGLIIRNGSALNAGVYSVGGGIYIDRCLDSEISNTAIINNQAFSGGGIYLSSSSNFIFDHVEIDNNRSGTGGGLMTSYCYNFSFRNCSFSQNFANSDGGAFFCWYSTSIGISNCVATNNLTGAEGTGLYFGGSSNITTRDCSISFNRSESGSSGIFCLSVGHLAVINCSLINNGTTNAVLRLFSSIEDLIISNCIIGGTNGSTTAAILEESSDTYNHTIVNNVFLTNTLGNLYYDFATSSYISNDLSWTNINITNYTGAAVAYGNTVQ